MRETLDQLLALQQIDTAIHDATVARAGLDNGDTLAAELQELETALGEAQKALDETTADLRDKELALATVEEKKKTAEERAYGGKVSNPRELEGLEKDIEQLARQKDRLEDEILELYDLAEERKNHLDEQTRRTQQKRAELEKVRSEYQERMANLDSRLQDLAHERDELAPTIAPAALKQYEAIRARASNIGIAPAEHGVCSACNMRIPSTTLKRLAEATTIITCDNCGRILHPGKG